MKSEHVFASQSLNDWLFYIENQHCTEIDLGLGRISQVANKAELMSFPNSKTVLVAGTNGKGTTIRFMEQYLLSQGYSVGVFSSPHIHRYTERVRVNGKELTEDEHVNAFNQVESVREAIPLTYFEYSALAAFKIFRQRNLDYLLIEVGLGGRLDATNIIEHDLAIITSIGLDHVDWLGSDLNTIAFEKAGIFRTNTPVVIGESTKFDAFSRQAQAHNVSTVAQLNEDYHYEVHQNGSWTLVTKNETYHNLPSTTFPLQNIATGINGLLLLDEKVKQEELIKVISNLYLPGRMQILASEPTQVVDVAHNHHAIKHLVSTLETNEKFRHSKQLAVVIAMMKDKDIAAVLSELRGKVTTWYVGELAGNNRAEKSSTIKAMLNDLGETNVHRFESVASAWRTAQQRQQKDELLLGCGSFYTVAEILSLVEVESD